MILHRERCWRFRALINERFGGPAGFGDDETWSKAALLQGLGGHETDDLGVIIVLAQMAQDEGGGAGIEHIAQEAAGGVVRQVPHAPHDALLDGPGIRADLEHFHIVVGFEQEHVGTLEMDADGIGQVAQIGGDGDFDAFGVQGEADGVDGVVRDGEAVYFDVADREA